MASEIVSFVKSRTAVPTYGELRAHFRRQGKELLVVEIRGLEIDMCQEIGIAYFEERGKAYAVATAEQF